ncbi:MAG: ABC transporter ATP-binding protein [Gammaproteobacteria bacterium]
MIQIDDLTFRYRDGEFRLRVPSLEVPRGQSLAIVGPSGSGKTTLLNLIAGILEPAAGKISVGDTEVTGLQDAARRDFRIRHMGLVFQEFELLDYLPVIDNVLLPYRITSALRLSNEVSQRAGSIAAKVGIADKLDRFPGQLSQGERQRAAICRALITEPSLLLADEPTGNLDPGNKGRVLDILFDYVVSTGTTLITVTHDHDLISRFDRVLDFRDFLSPGQAVA